MRALMLIALPSLNQRNEKGQRVSQTIPEVEVLTYVSRGFEEYRGFPQAMQAIALLQAHEA